MDIDTDDPQYSQSLNLLADIVFECLRSEAHEAQEDLEDQQPTSSCEPEGNPE